MAGERAVPNFQDYTITKSGEVWSIKSKKFLRQRTTIHGYKDVTLCKHGKKYSKTIHRLILEAHVGFCPKGMEACHNNGNKLDNRLKNLRWDTRSNNTKDAIRHGVYSCVVCVGEKHCNAKLTKQDVLLIRNVYNKELNGYRRWNQCQLAKKFNINQSQISNIVNNKVWKHI